MLVSAARALGGRVGGSERHTAHQQPVPVPNLKRTPMPAPLITTVCVGFATPEAAVAGTLVKTLGIASGILVGVLS